MTTHNASALLQLARPAVGSEVSKLIRELRRVSGVIRVAPGAKIPRLLRITYDPNLIALGALLRRARRGWAGARAV